MKNNIDRIIKEFRRRWEYEGYLDWKYLEQLKGGQEKTIQDGN